VSFLLNVLAPKRLELLTQMVPTAKIIGALINPANPGADSDKKDVLAAGQVLGREIEVTTASSERELEPALASLVERQARALIVISDVLFTSRKDQLVALAARYAIPTVYHLREFTVAGGLMSYGTSISDANRQADIYAARILGGVKPSDLPVMQSSKFELAINLTTAKALGLTVPPSLLVAADEVIE
jgi:putative ABC transport system substrate-binding protein